jgi:ABC-2 type transport system ATP-binding protein
MIKRHEPTSGQSHSGGRNNKSAILVAEDLRKSYGPRPALRGLSFSLQAGRVLGLLGPNGAGKTTAIRILTTILDPSSGRFMVDGVGSDQPERIRSKIGVLPESLGFPKQATGIEYLTYFGQLYGRAAGQAKAHGLKLLKDVGLDARARSLVGTYSRGMRQRLGIARALVNDPAVVFLDEPTLGLDPRGQQELLDLIRRIARERDAGVVLCSHFLSEIEAVCNDVVILKAGDVVAMGSVSEVIGYAQKEVNQRKVIRIRVPSESLPQAHETLEAMNGVMTVAVGSESGGWLEVEVQEEVHDSASEDHVVNNEILSTLIRAQIPVLGFETKNGRLQDVFLQLTEEADE